MKALIPLDIHPPFAAYSHGVSATPQRVILTSGQLGINPDGSIPDSVAEQARLCFAAIDHILAKGGMNRAQVARLNAFVTDRKYMATYMAERDAWLADIGDKPASTLMIVSGFTREEFLVEVEAIAIEEGDRE